MNVKFTDNSKEVLAAMLEAKMRALEACGLTAERYAKKLAPSPGKGGTGRLRNDINHKVIESESAVYMGTNVEYGIYHEFGTGKYTDGGRQDPWVYQDDEGRWHRTEGVKAQPFIKPAVADHAQEYRKIIESEMKK